MGAILKGFSVLGTGLIGWAAVVAIANRLPTSASPPMPPFAVQSPTTDPTTLTYSADRYGQFWIAAKANGQPLTFLVDTGASAVSFNLAEARRLGIDTSGLIFDRTYSTANGLVHAATAHLARLEIGSLILTNVEVSVMDGRLRDALLGMSLLRRMDVRVSNDTLTLRP